MVWWNTRTAAFPAEYQTLTSPSLLFTSSDSGLIVVVHQCRLHPFLLYESHGIIAGSCNALSGARPRSKRHVFISTFSGVEPHLNEVFFKKVTAL